jgi:hypothetical protein
VTDVRLQPIQPQDDAALLCQEPAQMAAVGQRGGEQFVVAVEQIGDGALGDRHPALAQGGMDLGHGAVVAVAQRAHERDDVETELVLRQHERALGLRPVGPVVADAGRVLAAADPQA